jgi:hypothetical protein
MAIKKTLTDNKGQTTNYHRIVAFAPIFAGETPVLSVNLASYTSEQYRNAEKENPQTDNIVASTQVLLPLFEDDTYSREKIYDAIMASPDWEDSELV